MRAPELSEKDLNFTHSTREIRVEERIRVAQLVIDQTEGSNAIADYVRRKFNLAPDFEVRVTICDTERTEDLCSVTIAQVKR